MTTTIGLVNELEYENAGRDLVAGEEKTHSQAQDEAKWTTKQVIAACLWSAFFGLGCGYAWLLLQIGTASCR